MTDAVRFALGLMAVVAFVFAVALAQGIGEAIAAGVDRLLP